MEKAKKDSEKVPAPGQTIQQMAFNGQEVTEEMIREWFMRDLKGVYVILAEILQTKECIDALAKIYHGRYLQMVEGMKRQPELDLNAKSNGDGV